MPPLNIGINIVWLKPELQVRGAQLVEELGLESVWVGEHLALPSDPDWWRNYPTAVALGDRATEDCVAFSPGSDFVDPLIMLAAIATVTTRVRLATGIYMLPLRHPVPTAKMLASLDLVSNGRIDFGVGLGWSAEEYRFSGADFSRRGRLMDESIRALRVLFESDTPEFEGDAFSFGPMKFEPKPVQRPFPILIGGGTPAAERRAARLGNGWHGSADSIARIKALLEAEGRAGEPFRFSTITLGPVTPTDLEAMAAKGCDRAVVTPWPGRRVGEVGEDGFRELEAYAREIGLG